MSTDAAAAPEPFGPGADVMASLETEGLEERLVIADISADGEWLAMSTAHTAPLSAWR